ncbi:MAG: hypothetical protein QOD72_2317, partial [Acidimicrobiaceae bacterium]|nr:hypothetical protein [Acidimicrobiaceae bacterium]
GAASDERRVDHRVHVRRVPVRNRATGDGTDTPREQRLSSAGLTGDLFSAPTSCRPAVTIEAIAG